MEDTLTTRRKVLIGMTATVGAPTTTATTPATTTTPLIVENLVFSEPIDYSMVDYSDERRLSVQLDELDLPFLNPTPKARRDDVSDHGSDGEGSEDNGSDDEDANER